jgi:TP901 family phage tail tape measure protein
LARTGTLVVRLIGDTTALTAATTGMSAKMAAAGKMLTKAVTLPVVAAGAASIAMASDFQSSMDKIEGLVGVSAKGVERLSAQVLDLAKTLPQSPKELSDALFFVTSAGFRGANAMDILKTSARAAAAGLGETKTVADAVTSAVNAYGIANLSAARAADILTATVKEGKTSAESVAPVLGNLLPLTSELGVGFDEVGASIASMTRIGLSAAGAATSLQGILNNLLKPTSKGIDALHSMGLSMQDVRDMIDKKGLLAALMNLRKGFGDNQEAMAAVFGNIRGLRGFLALTGKQADVNAGIFERLAGSTGVADRAFKKASDTADFKFQVALNNLRVAAIQIGDVLLPVAASIAVGFAGLTGAFSSLSGSTKQTIVVVALLAAAFGPLLSIISFLIAPITSLIGVFAAYRVAQAAVIAGNATLGQSWLLALGPVGLVIAALAALGIAFFIAYKKSATFRAIVDASLAAVLTAAQAVWTWLKANWPALLVILTGPFGVALLLIIHFWKQISGLFTAGVDALRAIWKQFGGDLTAIAKTYLDMVAKVVLGGLKIVDGIFKLVGALLRGDWSGAWDAIKQIASGALDVIKAIVVGGLKLIWAAIKLYGKLWGTAIGAAWNAIQNVFTDKIGALVSKMTSAGRSLIGGLKDGITGALSDIGSWIKGNVVDPIVNAVKGYFGISSPSKVFEGIGGHLMSGLFKGLSGSNWLDVSRKIFGGLPEALGAMVKKGLVSIADLPKKALNALMSLGGLFGSIFGGIGGGFAVAPGTAAADVVRRVVQSMQPSWAIDPEWSALVALINSESGFNPTAQNPTSSAYGLFQFLDSTWSSVGGSKTSDPALQTIYGLRYIASRYGDPLGAWAFHQAHNWYGSGLSGGLFTQPTLIGVGERGPERVDVTPVGRGGGRRGGGGPIYLTLQIAGQQVEGVIRGIARQEIEDEFGYQAAGA